MTIDDNGVDGLYSMVTQLDIKGNPLGIIDAKGRASFTYIYNMLNRPIKTTHLDNGVRYAMSDAVGNPFFSWDERNQQFRFSYDVLLRPTKTYLTTNYNTAPAAEHLISLTVYGESVPNPDINNLRGLPYLIFDAAGLVKNTAFDFKGNPSHTERQLATTYQTSPNWISLNNETTVSDLLLVASSMLESEVFSMSTTYDALNRPLAMIKPDDSEVIPSYNESGSLSSLKAKLRGSTTTTNFVSNIKYNERGQRKYITYANGSHTTYHYDNKTFRLNRLLTTRNTGADILQDLNYTYDPVGNIVEQIDNAQQTHFFNNTEVTPNGKYEYDPLYRLLKAQGRELIGLNVTGSADINISTLPENTTALRQYTESYVYDELGNIEKMIHAATGGNWTRHYHYSSGFTNNLLLSNSTDGVKPADQYTYDAHGNMLTMPHLNSMTWDYADRLQGADLGGGGTAFYHYDGEGNRVRKVIVHGNITEQRIYLGDYEVYRKMVNGVLDTERERLHIKDDTGSIAVIDTETTNSNTINIRYQLSNHLGSACLELDDTAETISYEEYHPFGTTAYRAGRNQTETSLKRYRYVGKERDEETGLYYYGARYYAGWLARFVSVDPLKDDYPYYTSYQYAGNKPINFIDLDGLEEALPPLLQAVQKDFQNFLKGGISDRKSTSPSFSGERPNQTFLSQGKSQTASDYKKTQGQIRKLEAQQNIQKLRSDISATSPFVGGGGSFGFGFAETTREGLVQGGYLAVTEIGIARATKFIGETRTAIRAADFRNVKSSTLFGGDALSSGSRTASTFSEISINAPKGILGAADELNSARLSSQEVSVANLSGEGRTFSHFTNSRAVSGITGIDEASLASLQPGEGFLVNELRFGSGQNSFMAGAEGEIFVTELKATTSSGKLNQIGVFGDKQNFAIQFSEETAFFQGAKPSAQNLERSIFTIPEGSTLQGTFKVIRTGN